MDLSFIIRNLLLTVISVSAYSQSVSYPIVDTGQVRCYDDRNEISYPRKGRSYYGQDAQYSGNQPRYRDNRDGTITDLVTGLMWQSDPGSKKYWSIAVEDASKCRTGGYSDWRMPTIKELYSLIDFSGEDIDPRASSEGNMKPFINSRYFKFAYGDTTGERVIDSQYASSTKYVSTTMNEQPTAFGVNFADGRIKGYPTSRRKKFYVIYVRGNKEYGKNRFVDNKDNTITDKATGLMWSKYDSGRGMDWKSALACAEKTKLAGYSDWRLPNAKELQSIVDYGRSPDTTDSPAIDPVFNVTAIKNEGGTKDYPFFWTSTTHKSQYDGSQGAYISFGRALGWMSLRREFSSHKKLMDVHGAGAQRGDPKSGNPSQYQEGRGPQGDVVRINNFVRLVRGGDVTINKKGPDIEKKSGSSNQFIRHLDKNNDGKISKSEFDGPSRHFSRLDRNHDGYISSDEAPDSPPGRRGGGRRSNNSGF